MISDKEFYRSKQFPLFLEINLNKAWTDGHKINTVIVEVVSRSVPMLDVNLGIVLLTDSVWVSISTDSN
jgi:hypothetical protein